ncbi:MAG: two-component regulator propeller domain-containing protein [Bacteroidota bacterium]
MNKFLTFSPFRLLLLSFVLISSCIAQDKTTVPQEHSGQAITVPMDTSEQADLRTDPFRDLNMDAQIMQVVRRVFQDSQENLWFVGDNVFCYDGDSLLDYSQHEVFERRVIRQMLEDQAGNLWFGTNAGIIKYDPSAIQKTGAKSFITFSDKDGLVNQDVWSMELDRTGNIWIGTLGGLSRYTPAAGSEDRGTFHHFVLPETEPDESRGVTSAWIVHSIMEDSKGNIWFATNGGAYVYDPSKRQKEDGTSLTNISAKDGLCHNSVNDLLEDKNGHIWFATHHNGVCRYDPSAEHKDRGTAFTHITSELGIKGTEAWSLYEDQSGNIWFPIEHAGIYRYDPSAKLTSGSLTNFHKQDGLPLNAVHSVVEDKEGRFWLGGFGGLYRYDPSASPEAEERSFVNITKDGSWAK